MTHTSNVHIFLVKLELTITSTNISLGRELSDSANVSIDKEKYIGQNDSSTLKLENL